MTFKSNEYGGLESSGRRHLEDNIKAIFNKDAKCGRRQNGAFEEDIVTAYLPDFDLEL